MYYGNELSYYSGYFLVLIGFIITFGAQALIKGSYSKYKKIANSSKTKGVDVARTILDANDLKNVKIEQVGGELSDHYDPRDKVVRLSKITKRRMKIFKQAKDIEKIIDFLKNNQN